MEEIFKPGDQTQEEFILDQINQGNTIRIVEGKFYKLDENGN